MGSWYMNLSEYMGVCGNLIPWAVGSKKSAFFPLQVFFSGIALIYIGKNMEKTSRKS